MKPILATFDFDGTIYRKDSFIEFAKFTLSPFRLLTGGLKSLPTVIRMKLGWIDPSIAKEKIFSNLYRNADVAELARKAEEFVEHIDIDINKDVMRSLELMRDRNAEIMIVSASAGFWLRPWAARHGIQRVIATEAEIKDGKFTGRFATPNCKGDEKVRRIMEIYPLRNHYHLEAWGDSDDDLPMLRFADISHRVRNSRPY